MPLKILIPALSDTPQFATVRGRQALVRNTLAGYEHSAQIDKTLRWVNWEGSAFEVADDLLRKLDGHDVAPGVPALALLAQAIEPMAGMAHREKLVELRRRMGWGAVADPSPSPAEDWRDERAAGELAQERLIGENTLRPLYYLRRALVAAEAVVRVELSGEPVGTGFLVAPDLMVTNHHVISDDAEAKRAQARFFCEAPDDEHKEKARREVVARAAGQQPLLYTSEKLDVTLIRLAGSPPLARYLPLRPKVMRQNDRVAIIQHPGGYPKQISLQNNLVAAANDRFVQYYTSTKAGSSGSPVLDDDFAVIAIHYRWVHNKAWDGDGQIRVTDPKQVKDLQYRNQGTSVIALLADLKKRAPQLLEELTVLPE